jgi:Kef-type K+ transport system membrane component KefB
MYTELLYIALVAVGAPLVVELAPRLRVPAVVLEIVGGIIIGPQLLDVVHPDVHVRLMSSIGLAFLLFLAGLELDIDRLRGPLAGLAARAFLVSVLLGLVVGYLLNLVGADEDPLLLAIILVATSLGVLVPVLKDAGEIESEFGQLVFISGLIAEFGSILLLSLFFSKEASSPESSLVLLVGFGVVIASGSFMVGRAWRSRWLAREMRRLEDSSSQLRVRAAVVVLLAFVVMANHLGLEAILGSFIAGALLRALDRADAVASVQLRRKLEVIGFGFVVPFFFVTTGITLDVKALFSSWTAGKEIVLFFAALLAVRGIPALLYRAKFGARRSYVAGLMQATSLTFIVVGAHVGAELGKIDRASQAALVTAGLLSVLLFPALALLLSGRREGPMPTVEFEEELEG